MAKVLLAAAPRPGVPRCTTTVPPNLATSDDRTERLLGPGHVIKAKSRCMSTAFGEKEDEGVRAGHALPHSLFCKVGLAHVPHTLARASPAPDAACPDTTEATLYFARACMWEIKTCFRIHREPQHRTRGNSFRSRMKSTQPRRAAQNPLSLSSNANPS
eukprot:g82695.t1